MLPPSAFHLREAGVGGQAPIHGLPFEWGGDDGGRTVGAHYVNVSSGEDKNDQVTGEPGDMEVQPE